MIQWLIQPLYQLLSCILRYGITAVQQKPLTSLSIELAKGGVSQDAIFSQLIGPCSQGCLLQRCDAMSRKEMDSCISQHWMLVLFFFCAVHCGLWLYSVQPDLCSHSRLRKMELSHTRKPRARCLRPVPWSCSIKQ